MENPRKEGELSAVILAPEAEKRLGVRTEKVERRKVERSRTFGGEVEVPPGRRAAVTAPFAGVLRRPPGTGAGGSGTLSAGAAVKAGETVFILKAVLTPEVRLRLAEARADAEGQVEAASVRVEAAAAALARAEKLLRDKAGSERALEEARAAAGLARAALKAAEVRRGLLDEKNIDSREGVLLSLPLGVPHDGILRDLEAADGQTVAAGAPLFEVVSLDRVWIRVPVYAGDLAEVDTSASARVARLPGAAGPGDPKDRRERSAPPVPAPPSAHAGAATVDLVYEVENAGGDLRPGERVEATLRLRGEEESLVVPWKAVLHDVHGGTWVYVRTAPLVFVMRRVEVRSVEGVLAVLGRGRGPVEGAEVVTDGAAEIYGTEFGSGK